MGVTLSKTSALAPISFASTVIGFISFAFTLATFLNVFWSELITFYNAPSQIHDYLTNLKQGLYEERTHLRRARRRERRKSTGSRTREKQAGLRSSRQEEDVSLRVMRETNKSMIKQFRDLERPFLSAGVVPARDEKGYLEEDEVDWPDYYREDYKKCGFRERFLWLRRKGDVLALLEGLARVETRRIAKEVSEVATMVRELGREVQDINNSVYGLEERMSRIVGIRRVD